MARKDLDKNPDYKCLFKCILEKDHILQNGALSVDHLNELLKDIDMDAAHKNQVLEAVPKCLNAASSSNDPCIKSYTFCDCITDIGN